jgi:outer membrane immunogenic protein
VRPLVAICALFAATSAAWAADSGSAPAPLPAANAAAAPATALPYSWAGFYVLGSGDLMAATGQKATNPLNGLSAASSAGPANATGGFDSGAFGANWQTGNTVVGFEGDMQWADQWTGPFGGCGLGCSLNNKVRVPYLATLRARAGTAFDRVFVYGTGGLATMGTSDNLNAGGYGTTPNFTNMSTGNIDWTIGAGMEMALDKNVSAKLEYLYMPNSSPVSAPGWLFESSADTVRNNIVRGGINYRLPVGQ